MTLNSIKAFLKRKDDLLFIISVLILSLISLLYRYYIVPSLFELESDAYYHVMMGYLFPDIWNTKTFEWTSFSIWSTSFYDKEWLFHFLLNLLYRWKSVFTSLDMPPFHYYYFVFNLMFLTSFALCLRRFSKELTFIWVFTCLFISPLFFYRLLMVRPQILSIILFLAVSMLCFTGEIDKRKKILIFVLGVIYVYAYSHPHFILIPPAIRFFWDFIISRRIKFSLIFSALGGFLAGMVLHPQFPNTFKIWWIQCVLVSNSIIFGLKEYGIGEELRAPAKALLMDEFPLYFFFILEICLFLKFKIYRRDKQHLTPLLCFMTLQVLMLVGFMFSQRAVEYAVPLSVIAAFLVWNQIKEVFPLKPIAKGLLSAGIGIICCLLFINCINKNLSHGGPGNCKSAFFNTASYMKNNIRPGTFIFNLDWSDFPFLFYPAPEFRYAVGLDPLFGAAIHPEAMALIEKYRAFNSFILSPKELSEITGAQFVFVSKRHAKLAGKMLKSGFQTAYYSNEGWLFDLIIPNKVRSGELEH